MSATCASHQPLPARCFNLLHTFITSNYSHFLLLNLDMRTTFIHLQNMTLRLRLEGVTFFNYRDASFVLSQNSDNWNRILNVLLCTENVRTTTLLVNLNAYTNCLDKSQSKVETQPQCLEHLDAEQGLQKILLLTPAAGNTLQQQAGLCSFSIIWFFNNLLYFYQAFVL